jgi:sulfofructose kinase
VGEIISIGLVCHDNLVMVPSLATVSGGTRVRAVLAQCGGVAATAAVAARALGARVQLWARVGDDDYGSFVLTELRRRGVDTSQVVIVEGARTPVSTVLVEEGTGERRFLYYPGEGLDAECEPPDYARVDRAKALLVDGRLPEVCLTAARRARAAGVPVVTDVGHAREHEVSLLHLADYPVISELALAEIAAGRELAGGQAPSKVQPALTGVEGFADEFLAGAAKAVVVTRGERGAWLKERGRPQRRIGAFPVEVVDTTGAGDVFHGAFAWAVANGRSPERAVEVASAAAAIACTALGGQTAAPDEATVEEALRSDSAPEWEDVRAP